jgi:curved DNA-binding protein
MEYKDYYKILGVPKNADAKTIKKAYRQLKRQYRRDVNDAPDAEARFEEINEAYEVLRDADMRAHYDQLRLKHQLSQRRGGQPGGFDWSQWQKRGGQPGGFDWSPWMSGAPGGRRVEYGDPNQTFSEFYQAIFGDLGGRSAATDKGFEELIFGSTRSRGQAPQVRGQDLDAGIRISLEEAYHGTTRMISKEGRRLQVKIPKGVKSGTRIRIAGEGLSGVSGQAGDLYLHVTVEDDPRFERQGDDLYEDITIDLNTAEVGGEVQVTTMANKVTLKIGAGTQPGQLVRLSGRGMPRLRQPDEYGDLFVRVNVDMPTDLSSKERD